MTRFSARTTSFLAAATLLSSVAAVNCSKGSHTSDVGTLQLALTLPDATTLNTVAYKVFAMDGTTVLANGSIDTSDKGATPSVDVSVVDSGGALDTVNLHGTTSAGVVCDGTSVGFPVVAGQPSMVNVTLVCGGSQIKTTKGSVIVNGSVVIGDNCPVLQSWMANPLQVSTPAGLIHVSALATDADMADVLSYAWTATAGTFVAAGSAATDYTCTTAGSQTLTVTVSDNHGTSPCTAVQTFPVKCVSLTCGNGVLDTGEACDPSAPADPNQTKCDANCHLLCGNGTVDTAAGEQCDPPLAGFCSATCQNITAVCGDGVVQPPETCEPPNTATCDSACHTIDACLTCESSSANSKCKAGLIDGPNGMVGCNGFTDATQKAACVALLSCQRTNHCANGNDPTPCLCGALDASVCISATTFPGLCAAQYAAAFTSNGPHAAGDTIFTEFLDPSTPVGIADNIDKCDVSGACTAVCTM